MERLIEDRLIKWKDAGRRKSLIVIGGRQTGKTWSVEAFGEKFFKNMLKAVTGDRSTALATWFI